MKLPIIKDNFPLVLLRIVMGLIFITHGLARLYYGSIPDFGGFLNSYGLIIGVPIAWAVTIFEIICGSLLVLGILVQICVIFHALVIISGIFLVHLPQGWFVVGHGSGGIEYSLLILMVLLVLYSRSRPEFKKHK